MNFSRRVVVAFVSLCLGLTNAQEPSYEDVLKKELVSDSLENTASAIQKPYVVMVSLDGFRYDYAEKHGAKNLLDMVQNGSSSVRLIPSFPSKTFPNHYTLVTGMYPETHGIVANSFYDSELKKSYRISDRQVVEDGNWYGGVPLWNLAQLQGMVAASYFWVGSEANVNGLHPKYYYRYNKKTPYEYRVKRVLEWLQLPENERPHFITLYFSLVDTMGHRFGPDALETKEAVQYVDEQIGTLRKGIKQLGLPVTLIVTSDHGMDNVSKPINIYDYIAVPKEQFLAGPVAMIYTKSAEEKEAWYTELVKRPLFKTYKKEEVPDYLNFSDNPRIGDLVLIADAPYQVSYFVGGRKRKELTLKGTHGYDPFENKNMGGIFYAEGPKIKKGHKISPFENIHIYPLVASLLELQLMMPIDGRAEVLMSILRKE